MRRVVTMLPNVSIKESDQHLAGLVDSYPVFETGLTLPPLHFEESFLEFRRSLKTFLDLN